jgi:hypothetical protein
VLWRFCNRTRSPAFSSVPRLVPRVYGVFGAIWTQDEPKFFCPTLFGPAWDRLGSETTSPVLEEKDGVRLQLLLFACLPRPVLSPPYVTSPRSVKARWASDGESLENGFHDLEFRAHVIRAGAGGLLLEEQL